MYLHLYHKYRLVDGLICIFYGNVSLKINKKIKIDLPNGPHQKDTIGG